jgi:hypothetical protein
MPRGVHFLIKTFVPKTYKKFMNTGKNLDMTEFNKIKNKIIKIHQFSF